MRMLAVAVLWVSLGFAQTPPVVTLSLANLRSAKDITAVTTALRTVLDIRDVQTDEARNAVLLSATPEKLAAAQWLLHQLDQPAGGPAVGPDYKIACADKWPDCLAAGGEVIRVLRLNPAVSTATLTAVVTSIRVVTDMQRLMLVEGSQAIAVRGTMLQANAAAWILHELAPLDGSVLRGDSAPYTIGKQPPAEEDESLRVFRIDPSATPGKLVGIVTAIRVVCDVQRLMPVENGRAILARSSADKLAVTEWLVHQLNAPSHPAGMVETTMSLAPREAPLNDYTVRIYYVHGTNRELAGLSKQLRDAGIPRTMEVPEAGAIVVRGRTDQVAMAQTIIDRARSAAAAEVAAK